MNYVFKSDFTFIFEKRTKLILMFMIVNLVSLLINSNINVELIDMITISTGTNIIRENFSIFQVIILIFNYVFFTFISLEVFIKDFSYELDNIFLRLKMSKWLLLKTFFLITFIIIMKIFQYSLLILISCLFIHLPFSANIINLLLVDTIYTAIIIFLYLVIYLISIFLFNNRSFYILGIIVAIILPHNVLGLYKYLYILISALLILIFLNFIIINKFNKKIIEIIKE